MASVLVVQSKPALLEQFRYCLETHGHEVMAVDSGAEAWEILQQQSFDAAVIDLRASGIHGAELVKRIRKAGSSLPVIMTCCVYWWPTEQVLSEVSGFMQTHEGEGRLLQLLSKALPGTANPKTPPKPEAGIAALQGTKPAVA